MAASFFNWASILWLLQLQDRLPVSDTRAQQDINKVIVALEYSADATLNSLRFAAKAIGSSVTARRLLWLCQWQADAKSKWRLATSPFEGSKLFGVPLEPLLIESRDKCCILPNMSRRSDARSLSSFRPSAVRTGDSWALSLRGISLPGHPDPRNVRDPLLIGASLNGPFGEERGGLP